MTKNNKEEIDSSVSYDTEIMTQENKELLLKDLCARLPYGVIAG